MAISELALAVPLAASDLVIATTDATWFRYLRRSEFLAVIAAEGWLTVLDAHRKTLRGLDDPDHTVKPWHLDADYKETLEKVEEARNALQRLSIEGQEFDPE